MIQLITKLLINQRTATAGDIAQCPCNGVLISPVKPVADKSSALFAGVHGGGGAVRMHCGKAGIRVGNGRCPI